MRLDRKIEKFLETPCQTAPLMNHLNEKNSVLNRPMYLCLCPVCLGQFLDTGIYKIVRENHGQAKERCDFCNYRNGYDFIIYSKAEKKDEVADEWQ